MSLNEPVLPSALRRQTVRWLAALLLCIAGTASAKDYRIELILFENLQPAGSVTPGDLYYPVADDAVALDSEAARADGFTHLADSELRLTREAQRITNTSRYRLLLHTAWQQPGLDDDSAVALRFSLGESFELYLPDVDIPFDTYLPARLQPEPEYRERARSAQLIGNLKVRLGRFLHMDVNMVFTDLDAGRGYRLTQSRKMRSRELHYIDNERFGLLTLITPVEGTDEPEGARVEPGSAPASESATPEYEASPSVSPDDVPE